MTQIHTASQPSRTRRATRFIWRWAPHVASILATGGFAVGAVLLGGDDYAELSGKTLTWGWSLVALSVVLVAFATIAHGLREHDRSKLVEKLDAARSKMTKAEERVGALQRALQENLRSRLLHTKDDLGITAATGFRITLYSHNMDERCLVRRARYSSDYRLEDVREGRPTIPDDTGLIGLALATRTISVYTVATQRVQGVGRPAWENWMVSKGNVSPAVAANLRMETNAYMFAPIHDPSQGKLVGMLVVEFEKANAAPAKIKLRDSMARRGRDLAVALDAVERELRNTMDDVAAEDRTDSQASSR